MGKGRNHVVDRVLSIQAKLDRTPAGLTLDEIAAALSATQRSAYRYVQAFTRHGYTWENGRLQRGSSLAH